MWTGYKMDAETKRFCVIQPYDRMCISFISAFLWIQGWASLALPISYCCIPHLAHAWSEDIFMRLQLHYFVRIATLAKSCELYLPQQQPPVKTSVTYYQHIHCLPLTSITHVNRCEAAWCRLLSTFKTQRLQIGSSADSVIRLQSASHFCRHLPADIM